MHINKHVSGPGGQYRLCWCAGALQGFNDNYVSDYSTSNQDNYGPNNHSLGLAPCGRGEFLGMDFGSLTLIAPTPLKQDQTCVSGQSCLLTGLDGHGQGSLSVEGSILVADTCGVPFTGEHGMQPWLITGQNSTANYEPFSSLVSTAAGGTYRLCWCASVSMACGTAESFRVDLGALHMVGPSPLWQDRTCIAGETCAIDSLHGHGLSEGNTLLVLDTCGVPFVRPRMAGAGRMDAVARSGSFVSWGPARHTGVGGQYRLCWCAGTEASQCTEAMGFRTDAGKFDLIGPSPHTQHRTCVSGRTCAVDAVVGQDIEAGGRLMVLETCALSTLLPRTVGDGLSEQVFKPQGFVSWGELEWSSAGGEYRLCWCGDRVLRPMGNSTRNLTNHTERPCERPQDFAVDIGTFTLRGPSPLRQDHTCLAGATCAFDGLLGQTLSTEDVVLALDTCGVDRTGGIPRFTHYGLLEAVSESGAALSWGETRVTSAGGQYRLCWCSSLLRTLPLDANNTGSVCSTMEQFRTDFGELVIMGPSPLAQQWTCVSGFTCMLENIHGKLLTASDSFLVLQTCGTADHVIRFPNAGRFINVYTDSANHGLRADFEDIPVTAQGGQYRLCWCAGSQNCGTADMFVVDFGELTLLGTETLFHHRTCVSGQTCLIDGVRDFKGDFSSGSYLLEDIDKFRWVASNIKSFYFEAADSLSGPWSLVSSFNESEVEGAENTTAHGTWGWQEFALPTTNAAYLRFVINETETPENVFGAADGVGGWGGWCTCPDGQRYNVGDNGDSCGSLACEGGAAGPCDKFVDASRTGKKATCARTESRPTVFEAELCGWRYRSPPPNHKTTYGCYSVDVDRISYYGGAFTDNLGYTFSWPYMMDGSVEATRAWVLPASEAAPFQVTFDLRREQQRDGLGTQYSSLLILDTCGALAQVAGFPYPHPNVTASLGTSSGVSYSWGPDIVSTHGGEYRLCWCASGFSCSTVEHFQVNIGQTIMIILILRRRRSHTSKQTHILTIIITTKTNLQVDIGDLTVVGPAPQSQHRTCVSGQTCWLHDILGQDLGSADKFVVLDTCGIII